MAGEPEREFNVLSRKMGLNYARKAVATAISDFIRVMRTQNHSDSEILEAVEKALEELKDDEKGTSRTHQRLP